MFRLIYVPFVVTLRIRNVPEENKLKYEKLKAIRVNWKQQAEKIELEYKKAEAKKAGQGAVIIVAGVAVAAFGPTAAMGIATTFGLLFFKTKGYGIMDNSMRQPVIHITHSADYYGIPFIHDVGVKRYFDP